MLYNNCTGYRKSALVVTMLIGTSLAFAQIPKGPGGKLLYQKGDCKEIIAQLKYECEFCEDEQLTKNCQKYDCSLTACKPKENALGSEQTVNIEGKTIRIAPANPSDSVKRIDLTNEFALKKKKTGTILIYETVDHDKVYGVYKNNELQEWYVITKTGKKLMPGAASKNTTTCQQCVITSSGAIICASCTITQWSETNIKTN